MRVGNGRLQIFDAAGEEAAGGNLSSGSSWRFVPVKAIPPPFAFA
jgi:hypothetical protein